MDYKNELKTYFADSASVTQDRYEVAKDVFTGISLLFFLNYFFVGAKFYDQLFLILLPFTYFSFVLSFGLFGFFYFKNNFDLKHNSSIILAIFLVVVGIIFLFPFSGINL